MRNSIVDCLTAWSDEDPSALMHVVLAEDGSERSLTVGECHGEMVRWAGGLYNAGVRPGEGVVLMLPHSAELIFALWGAMRLDTVPSIVPFPAAGVMADADAARLASGLLASGARALVVPDGWHEALSWIMPASLLILGCSAVSAASKAAGECELPSPTADSEILLYSSGTAGTPKAIRQTHGAIISHARATASAQDFASRELMVSWLPLFHEFGLMASVIGPVVFRYPCVLMSAFAWVRDPGFLFRVIDRFQATRCYMPNFAIAHCARSVRSSDIRDVRLESLRMVLCASDPVRIETLDAFADRFEPYGFDRRALAIAYGMTESCGAATIHGRGVIDKVDWIDRNALEVAASALPVEASDVNAMPVMSCGAPVDQLSVAILIEGVSCTEDRRVGEVGLKGPSVVQPSGDAGWFLTGDLGYMLNGELHVCGRSKDLIIHAGRKLHPENIENCAAQVSGLRPGRIVAFGIDDRRTGTESVVVVGEVKASTGAEERVRIAASIRQRLIAELQVAATDVRLVTTDGWIVKTTSGKVACGTCRKRYMDRTAAGAAALD